MNAFRSHREKLYNEMSELGDNQDNLQDKMKGAMESNNFCSSLLSQIEEWHKFPIEKTNQVRQQVVQRLDFKWIKLKRFLLELIH